MNELPTNSDSRWRRVVSGAADAIGWLATLAIVACGAWWATHEATDARLALLSVLDVALLVFFAADVALRVVLARGRMAALGGRWFDLAVVPALLQALAGEPLVWPWFLLRQALALGAMAARLRASRQLLARFWGHPGPLLVGSFAGAIAVGTALLSLPVASTSGESIGLVDALFTSTSAVCVTGLIVKNTGADFTHFGQLVILALIQLGGLGIMTFSVAMLLLMGRRLAAAHGVAMRQVLDQESGREVQQLLRFIVRVTFGVEAAGAAVLFVCLASREGYTARCAYHAVFHAVSAFCNAGFSLYGNSFEAFRGHVGLNLAVTSLIIVGGLGFPVLRDLMVMGRRRRMGEGRSVRLHTGTRVVLTTSAVLIVLGAVLFYSLERGSTLGNAGPGERVLASYFQSVTARTAGFNTVDIASVRTPVLVVLMFLMFIGASPGSTGGGVKTTTAAILFQAMRSAFRRRPEVEFFGRTVPRAAIRRATALVTLSALLLVAGAVALTAIEPGKPFEKLLFEEISAFGTVGLTTGITPLLTAPGKLVVIMLMFTGRVGPLTLMFSLLGESRPARYKYPETHIMVG